MPTDTSSEDQKTTEEQSSDINPDFYSPNKKSEKENPDLAAKENSANDDTETEDQSPESSLYKPKAEAPKTSDTRSSKKKRGPFVLLLGGGLISLFSLGFFFLFPALKIEHMIEHLKGKYFATSENAISTETNSLFSGYIKNHVIHALNTCGSTINRKCNPTPILGDTPISNLYRGWKDSRLETKLAEKYGLEFQYNKKSGKYYMHTRDMSGNGIDLTEWQNKDNHESLDDFIARQKNFKEVKPAAIRAALDSSLENETKFKQVFYRIKYGNFVDRKYNVLRCVVVCKTKTGAKAVATIESLNSWKLQKKQVAKTIIIQRVIDPHNELLGLMMQCVVTDGCASLMNNTDTGPDGSKQSQLETQLQSKLSEYRASFADKADGEKAVADLINHADEINKKGYTQYLADLLASKLTGKAGELATKAAANIPVIGWVNRAAQVIQVMHDTGPAFKKMSYVVQAASAVAMYQTYATYADEIKSGNVDGEMVGSFVSTLDSGTATSDGGATSAESSPLYQNLIGDGAQPVAYSTPQPLLAKITSSSVLAATSAAKLTPSKMNCQDGPLPAGMLVCPEEQLGTGNKYLSGIANFFNVPPMSWLTGLASLWNSTLGSVINFTTAKLAGVSTFFLENTPIISEGYAKIQSYVGQMVNPLIEVLSKYLIPSPITNNMSGGRVFDVVASGADVAGNDTAHHVLGGQKLSTAQVAEIDNAQQLANINQFQSKPLLARLADTSDSRSFVSKMALVMPNSRVSLFGSSFFKNPFKLIFSSIGSIFTPRSQAAAAGEDPFNVTQYGYALNDPVYSSDPEKYWADHKCSDQKTNADWNSATTISSDNGMPDNNSTNGCMLLLAAVGSAGALYTDKVLTADELSGTTSSSSTAGPTAAIDMANLYMPSAAIPCDPRTKDLGIADGYYNDNLVKIRICALSNLTSSGQESSGGYGVAGANGKAVVNSRVSTAIYNLVDAALSSGHLATGASSSFRTMAHQQQLCNQDSSCRVGNYTYVAKPGSSNHQMGLAIDFNINGLSIDHTQCVNIAGKCTAKGYPDWDWLDSKAAGFGFKQYINEFWHWSPTGN